MELGEYIATAIGAAHIGLALVLLVRIFRADRVMENFNADAFRRQKDTLLLALGLLGTVMGYYFGRLPAEQQANASRMQAEAANDAALKAAKDEQKSRQFISYIVRMIGNDSSPTGGGGLNEVRGEAFASFV